MPMTVIPNVLTIAGSDSSGGAGIQADLKTFAALGVYGMSAITALTAQNTQGVQSIVQSPPRFVRDQIDSVFDDITVGAVKIGMLASADIINVVADSLEDHLPEHVILDPVMVATSGDALIDSDALAVMKARLFPLASVVTPNIPEAEKLLRKAVLDMDDAALALAEEAGCAVLLKGGHLKGQVMRDVLAVDGVVHIFEAPRVETENTHGTGCTLSSAIASYMAHGISLADSCDHAKRYLTQTLKHADVLDVGCGAGPVCHGYSALSHHEGAE